MNEDRGTEVQFYLIHSTATHRTCTHTIDTGQPRRPGQPSFGPRTRTHSMISSTCRHCVWRDTSTVIEGSNSLSLRRKECLVSYARGVGASPGQSGRTPGRRPCAALLRCPAPAALPSAALPCCCVALRRCPAARCAALLRCPAACRPRCRCCCPAYLSRLLYWTLTGPPLPPSPALALINI